MDGRIKAEDCNYGGQSHKSTQKRQKHYFEQKRQQQQQTTWSENISIASDSSNQIQSNNRSLDVLSLLNVPTVVQNHRPQCVTENDSSNEWEADNPIDITETMVNASGQFGETVSPGKLALLASDNMYKISNENDGIEDEMKEDSDPLLSVLSLISKNGQNINPKGRIVPEAHVAFSVEGVYLIVLHCRSLEQANLSHPGN
ncbi:uncharacterized protein LOC124919133 [Impatiens glandulifera]|uniref:uncharacterized protein LOC124919133 n=1 Tax=Impatiens glandulifera TaxID=253017 RepID=UPI001FB04B9C|nr:uncharacterized protein LOC124919133 [Impatiens glandulifera]